MIYTNVDGLLDLVSKLKFTPDNANQSCVNQTCVNRSSENQQGFFQQFWKKAPGQNWEKMIDLTDKLGEINDVEHNKGKIYPQNQVILDCIMPTIPLKHKCLSFILIWVIVSHK